MFFVPYLPPDRLARGPSSERSSGVVVLAAVDLSGEDGPNERARRVVRVAAKIAESRNADLHVVHAWRLSGESLLSCPVRGVGPARLRKLQRGAARVWRTRLERLRREELGRAPATLHVIHGDARTVVPALAARLGADLAVLGVSDRGPGWRLFSRTTLDHALARLECDVLAVHPHHDEPLGLLGA